MDCRKISKSLIKKDFLRDDKDHHFYYYIHEGKVSPIRTKLSHGKKDIGKNLIGLMARQLKLSVQEFKNLIDCPMTKEEYKKHLESNGYLTKIAKYLA